MDKFKNKYRIQSHRKPNWDYSADALYFLTIVTQNRKSNLGRIVNNEMILSVFGRIVETEWDKSFEMRQELKLHGFVLMPNHLHAVVGICNGNDHIIPVETHGRASLRVCESSGLSQSFQSSNPSESPQSISNYINDFPTIKRNPPVRLPKSISSFIAGFKSAVNTKIDDYIDEHKLTLPKYNRKNHFFQPNYHDHIIRNYFEYQNILAYIENNPSNWNKDKFGWFGTYFIS